jgi:tetratricopeptide (TPR) repeat protein
VGRLSLTNGESSPATDVTVSFFVRQFMDVPKECARIPEMKPGEIRTVDLFALFKNNILEVTQATKVAAEITVNYTLKGQPASVARGETIRLYDRNAMTWDDNRKAAAFVTAKEPAVLSFSNNVNALLKGKRNNALDKNLQAAIGIHDALRCLGISYVSNPLTPYAVVSKNRLTVDTLKFPRQTFEYRSGDCSDLSILYCALMESLQIETAFITIPGHIFMAFALKSSPDEAREDFSGVDQLIFREGKAWIAVEVTERAGTFLAAWEEGAREWNDNLAAGQAGFYPLREAWKTYEPVWMSGSGSTPEVPSEAAILKDFQDDLSRLIDRELRPRAQALQAEIGRSGESPKAVNALGVLYARFGLMDKAEEQFQKVIARSEYVPALLNLGNLNRMKQDVQSALKYYRRAYDKAPLNGRVLLCLARASREAEDFEAARNAYDELQRADPVLARENSYLATKSEESTRAAESVGIQEEMRWVQE